jgi:hypothetical protein
MMPLNTLLLGPERHPATDGRLLALRGFPDRALQQQGQLF